MWIKLLNFGEGHYFIELALNLLLAHAQDGAAQVNVIAARQLRVEARANFEQRANTPVNPGISTGGLGDTCQNFSIRYSCPRRSGQ